MNLSAEFKNNAGAAVALMPSLLATIASIYFIGPWALVPTVITASVLYIARNNIANARFDNYELEKIEPTPRQIEILQNMGFTKIPSFYDLKSGNKNALAAYDNIVFENGIYEILTDREREFVTAHEAAHIQRRDGLPFRMSENGLAYGGINILYHFVGSLIMGWTTATDPADVACGAIGFIAPLFTAAVGSRLPRLVRSAHKMEIDCDRRAVLATGDIDAGISALEKMATGTFLDALGSKTHPPILMRIRALEELKYGAPVTNDFDAFVRRVNSHRESSGGGYNFAFA